MINETVNLRSVVLLAALALAAGVSDAGAADPVQPTGLATVHRSGQTFITWNERAELAGESYRVYRHSEAIGAGNLDDAELLYEVWEGSSRFFANRYSDSTWQERYLQRYVIADGGDELAAGTGLLVWTLHDGEAGDAHYAVTAVDSSGQENVTDFSPGNTSGTVAEAVADPLPVRTAVDIGPGGHLYIQFMDLRRWNPTFHAPNPSNSYYGLSTSDPAVENAIQYAYDYTVYEPLPDACDPAPDPVPVLLVLHGWGGNSYGPMTSDSNPWYCAYKIFPVDQSETWHFGFARDHDYRLSSTVAAGDVIVNFTEQRELRMVHDLLRDPPGLVAADPQRIYVYGHSMGGTGTLALSLRFANVFAAAYANQPMTKPAACGDAGGVDWRGDAALKWGSPALDLPVDLDAPAGWGDHLQAYDGTGVWTWNDHQANISGRPADEAVPFGVSHGRNDWVLEWPTQGQPFYGAANSGRRAWAGDVSAADHTWVGFGPLPPTIGEVNWAPFAGFAAVRSETVPGLSNASNDPPLPPTDDGTYNSTLRWSASWDSWDGAPTDTPTTWSISLCSVQADPWDNPCGSGTAQTVDVTPRRVQAFVLQPGLEYAWENRRVSDNDLVASGTVTADQDGLVTVPAVQVSPAGNRLAITATDPSFVFADGFESGDTSRWSPARAL